jgi:hypothetical protein
MNAARPRTTTHETDEMTDAEVADQIERADRFIEQLRDAITATVVDPASLCADAQRCGLRRIADTLDAVPSVTFCNLANLDAAMRGTFMSVIELYLRCVGAGPTLDYAVERSSRDLHRAGRHRGRGGADAAGVALTTGGAGEGLRQSATQTRRRLI